MEKLFLANGNLNKARLAALISDKIDFKTNTIIEDKLHNDQWIDPRIYNNCKYLQHRSI